MFVILLCVTLFAAHGEAVIRKRTAGGETCRHGIGLDYRGHAAVTRTGLHCQRWDAQIPNPHRQTPAFMPEASLTAAHNYCRNPDRHQGGPWCYTLSSRRWETCDIQLCPERPVSCRSGNGMNYNGHVSQTMSGLTCQRWDARTPHEHSQPTTYMPETSLTAAENYCRNPDRSPTGPWCYTTEPQLRWEHCDIPPCPATE